MELPSRWEGEAPAEPWLQWRTLWRFTARREPRPPIAAQASNGKFPHNTQPPTNARHAANSLSGNRHKQMVGRCGIAHTPGNSLRNPTVNPFPALATARTRFGLSLRSGCSTAHGLLCNHPIRQYFQRGIAVAVNTDDPKMFGTSLAKERRLLVSDSSSFEKTVTTTRTCSITDSKEENGWPQIRIAVWTNLANTEPTFDVPQRLSEPPILRRLGARVVTRLALPSPLPEPRGGDRFLLGKPCAVECASA